MTQKPNILILPKLFCSSTSRQHMIKWRFDCPFFLLIFIFANIWQTHNCNQCPTESTQLSHCCSWALVEVLLPLSAEPQPNASLIYVMRSCYLPPSSDWCASLGLLADTRDAVSEIWKGVWPTFGVILGQKLLLSPTYHESTWAVEVLWFRPLAPDPESDFLAFWRFRNHNTLSPDTDMATTLSW